MESGGKPLSRYRLRYVMITDYKRRTHNYLSVRKVPGTKITKNPIVQSLVKFWTIFEWQLDNMSLAATAEALLMEYSNYVDLYFNGKDRKRPLKCSFCNRSYKYQQVLNNHVNSQHMDKLKQISDQERMEMINNFLLDDSKIMFPEFYRRYFTSSSSTTSTSGSRNPWILSLDNWGFISSI